MEKADPLIRTKLHLPFTRQELVLRPRLQEQISQGLALPLTLISAPAGFGKTTLLASCIADCGVPVAWLSLDKNDNHTGRFLTYLLAAIQEVDKTIGIEAVQRLSVSQEALPDTILTSIISDLDVACREIILVLDDYQFISNQAVHEAVTFLVENCPNVLHLIISTRSDPRLPLARLRARGQTVEIRAADLRFTAPEAAQFLNEVMGLHLDASLVAVLSERTEGWIAGLQMAALSMRDRKDISSFIKGFSGTNRYILDYLLEEVLTNQSSEVQRFLLYTSILERMTAPLCDVLLANDEAPKTECGDQMARAEPLSLRQSTSILEYLERSNLFLEPLDDERIWYRYHHLFADLLRSQLQKSLREQGVIRLHLRAAAWFEKNSFTLEAINHASLASDFEQIERLIEQYNIEMMHRGEISWSRFWMGKLSKEVITRRPWLSLYEAMSCSWFGQLEEANFYLNEAEQRIREDVSAPGAQSMLGYHAYVKSRIIAMQGDIHRAIELCRVACENVPEGNLGLQIDFSITLGYEYFLYGDFVNAQKTLQKMIQLGHNIRAFNNPVAGYAILARMQAYQGRLRGAYDLLQKAAHLIHDARGQYLGVNGLIEVGTAALKCEWNDLEAALAHIKRGLDLLHMWGKTDDFVLAYVTLARIQLALGKQAEAAEAINKATQLVQTSGVFSEARNEVEAAQVQLWLVQGDWQAINRWVVATEDRIDSSGPFRYEDELIHITQARAFINQNKRDEASHLLSCLEEAARSAGRQGRLIEITILKALMMHRMGQNAQAENALTECLNLAEPERYLRIFLDEGQPMQILLAQWLAHCSANHLRDYAILVLSQFDAESHKAPAAQGKVFQASGLIEPLSQRELEVLHLMAVGMTNQGIAQQLIVARGTVKAHAASIYRKLDVSNRTEAVARARQLGILP